MPSELTRLFSKTFVLGYFAPAVMFLMASCGILYSFGVNVREYIPTQSTNAFDIGILLFAVWFVAVIFLALNRAIIQLLEGYGRYNPFRLKSGLLRREYRKREKVVAEYRREIDDAKKQGLPVDGGKAAKFGQYLWRLSTDFPDGEAILMPTKFGNAVRSFEAYPRVVYGMESIYCWNRLLAVIPTEYREMVDNEKAQMDFWVNLWFGACVIAIVSVGYGIYQASGIFAAQGFLGLLESAKLHWLKLCIPIAASAVAFVAAKYGLSAAKSWGTFVTSAFDLYRADLCRKFGYRLPETLEQEREFWQLLSQVWVYRSPKAADRLNQFRKTD